MTQDAVRQEASESTSKLKTIFEQSIALLSEEKSACGEKENPLTNLARRTSLPLHIDSASLQKRALDDAARALATLWKISKPERTKLPSRALPCSR
jgi:hypothetical protein